MLVKESKSLLSEAIFWSVTVSEEAKSCQCNKIERSYTRKWPPLLYIWIHEGKSLSVNEGQVCLFHRTSSVLSCFI